MCGLSDATLPKKPRGRCIVGGLAWPLQRLRRRSMRLGLTLRRLRRCRHALRPCCACGRIKIVEAAHPVPDAGSEAAAGGVLNAVPRGQRD